MKGRDMPESHWQKSTYCEAASSCINLAAGPGGTIHLRESEDPHAIVTTTPDRLRPLVSALKAGRFDRAGALAP
ncbi:DUF397 domain-containing protein [Streptomyces sp. NPDC046261]|uniref:DUF397 domain-containing protein n=1 Tax=Streptomyces sp. NPDC046261 TaxID=3157200 RepID=UPI0033F2B798